MLFSFLAAGRQRGSQQSSQPTSNSKCLRRRPLPPSPKNRQNRPRSLPQPKIRELGEPDDKGHDYSKNPLSSRRCITTYRFEADGTGRKEIEGPHPCAERGRRTAVGTVAGGLQLGQRARRDSLRARAEGRWQRRQGRRRRRAGLERAHRARSSGLHRLPPEAHHGARTAARRGSGIRHGHGDSYSAGRRPVLDGIRLRQEQHCARRRPSTWMFPPTAP